MPKKPKRRSVASYRAASLKGARTKRRMKMMRDENFREIRRVILTSYPATLDDMLPPEQTINRLPKVEFGK